MSKVLAPAAWQAKALAVLDAHLARFAAEGLPVGSLQAALTDPLRDFLARPGKGVRAALVGHGWHLAGGTGEPPAEVVALVELLHAGSLVLDDIQDGSVLRRGQPALHRQIGMPLAINAGNYLLFMALALCDSLAVPVAAGAELRRLTLTTLLRSHEGQALDLSAKVTKLQPAELPGVVAATTAGKTGALMALAAGSGAIAAGAPAGTVTAIADFGGRLGTALQMLDDLGGLTNPTRTSKGDEDLLGDRPTWPWAWLAESLPAETFRPLQRSLAAVIRRERSPESLTAVMKAELGDRRQTVSTYLHEALSELERAIGPSAALNSLRQSTLQMEQDYV